MVWGIMTLPSQHASAANINKPASFRIAMPIYEDVQIVTNDPSHVNATSRPALTQDHFAIDFLTEPGTFVYPLAPGTVIFAGKAVQKGNCADWSRYGTFVVIAHSNGFSSLYAHLDTTFVSTGQRITLDTILGTSGQSTCRKNAAMTPRVHVALYRNAKFANNGNGRGPFGGDAVKIEPMIGCQLVDGSPCTNLYKFRNSKNTIQLVYNSDALDTMITPTFTPEPTETPEPTFTPEPTETPEPTFTPEPTETPEPTFTPEPTETPELPSCAEVSITGIEASNRRYKDAIKVDWDGISCRGTNKEYRIYVDNPGKLLRGGLSSSEYKHTGLKSGRSKKYWVKVCAIDGGAKVCSAPFEVEGRTR